MSVPKGKRNETRTEFYNNLSKLQDIIINLLMNDFGVKISNRDLKAFIYKAKMSSDDAEKFKNLCNQYDINVEYSFPIWYIEYFRNKILNTLNEIEANIILANSIYPTTEYQWDLRLSYSEKAIGNCYLLLSNIQFLIRTFPGHKEKDMNRFLYIAEIINNEINSLKRWIKSDRAKRKKLLEKINQGDQNPDVSPTFTNSKNFKNNLNYNVNDKENKIISGEINYLPKNNIIYKRHISPIKFIDNKYVSPISFII